MLEQTRPTGFGRARGLVSSRISGGRVSSATYAPPAALADVVESLWLGKWDLRGQAPHVTELLGDPCVHVCLEHQASRVVGVFTKLWRRELSDQGEVRAAKLRAGAASAVLGTGVTGWSNRIVPLATGLSRLHPSGSARDAATLERRVLAPADVRDGLWQLCRWLSRRIEPLSSDARLARDIVARIQRDSTLSSVKDVCHVAGVSLRPLQRLFRAHVGATPKWVVQRFRLQEVAVRIERGEVKSLAHLAAELGYADHAHLTRDFKRATGKTPAAFAKNVWQ